MQLSGGSSADILDRFNNGSLVENEATRLVLILFEKISTFNFT